MSKDSQDWITLYRGYSGKPDGRNKAIASALGISEPEEQAQFDQFQKDQGAMPVANPNATTLGSDGNPVAPAPSDPGPTVDINKAIADTKDMQSDPKQNSSVESVREEAAKSDPTPSGNAQAAPAEAPKAEEKK
jgi:hypothetical protein